MDIHMPKLDGIEATRRIMQTHPVPIVIVSTSTRAGEVETTFKAMEAGAVAVVEKPPRPGHPWHAELAQKLVEISRNRAAYVGGASHPALGTQACRRT